MSKTKRPLEKLMESLGKDSNEINSALEKNNLELRELEKSNRFYAIDPTSNKKAQVAYNDVEKMLGDYFASDSVESSDKVAVDNVEVSVENDELYQAKKELVDVLKGREEQLKENNSSVNPAKNYESPVDNVDELESGWVREGEEGLDPSNYVNNKRDLDSPDYDLSDVPTINEDGNPDWRFNEGDDDWRFGEQKPSLGARIKNYFSRSSVDIDVQDDDNQDNGAKDNQTIYEPLPQVVSEEEKKEFSDLEKLAKSKVEDVLERANQQLADAKNDYNILDDQYSKLKSEYDGLRVKNDQLVDKLEGLNSVRKDNQDLEQQYALLQNELQEKSTELSEAQSNLEEATSNITNLENELQEYEAVINDDETLQRVQEERKKGAFYKLSKGAVALALIAGVGAAGYMLGKDDVSQPESQIEYVTDTVEVPVETVVEKEVVDTEEIDRLTTQVTDLTADSRYLTIKSLLDNNDQDGLVSLTEKYITSAGGELRVQGNTCDAVLGNLYNMMVSDEGLADPNSRNKFVGLTNGKVCVEPTNGKEYTRMNLKIK